jgi:hypothetical protein
MELKQERKPYNSDLHETHTAILDTASFYAQQVSHHPPITAFAVVDRGGLQLQANFGADIRFHGNSVTAETTGYLEMTLNDEIYKIDKVFPSMGINNVIWGTRSMNWVGDLLIECEASGYTSKITFSHDYYLQNTVKGYVSQKKEGDDITLCTFEGLLGSEELTFIPTPEGIESDIEPITLLTPHSLQKDLSLVYPNKSDPMETLNVWKEMTYYIVKEDLLKADEANHKRRARAHHRAATLDPEFERHYFKWQEEKGRFIINPDGIPHYAKPTTKTQETTTTTFSNPDID